MISKLLSKVAAAVLVLGLATAATWSLRAAWADRFAGGQTPEAIEAALRWMPGNGEYAYRLAILTAEGDTTRSNRALERAVALNPQDARSFIELGLRREADGNSAEAERLLLQASEIDRQYLPRWTLANFYFRLNDIPRFWHWAQAAGEMVYPDAAVELFRLCGRVAEDGTLIDRIAIAQPAVRASYLRYLMGQDRPDLLIPAARKVLESARQEDVAVLMDACDRLLGDLRVSDAAEIWNTLAESRRIPFTRAGGDPPQLPNARFSADPSSHGFDWRLPGQEGVAASMEDASGGLRLTFSGGQPERCDVLAQLVPLRPNTSYTLRFKYRTSAIAPGAGLAWQVTDVNLRRELGESESLSSEDEREGSLPFRTPAASHLVSIALAYRRAPGTVRIAGFVVLSGVEIEPDDGTRSRVR